MKTILGSMKGEDFLTFIKDDLGPKLRSEHRVQPIEGKGSTRKVG
jgi:hypothetical protein